METVEYHSGNLIGTFMSTSIENISGLILNHHQTSECSSLDEEDDPNTDPEYRSIRDGERREKDDRCPGRTDLSLHVELSSND